nr:MAG TPA: hypothetical protein [Caudoviricetes sp.]
MVENLPTIITTIVNAIPQIITSVVNALIGKSTRSSWRAFSFSWL